MSLSKKRTLSDPIQIHFCGTGGRSMITPEIEDLKGIEGTMSNCINEFVRYAPTREIAEQMEVLCNKVLDILEADHKEEAKQKRLVDTAYRIATGALTTTVMNKKEFINCYLMDHVWQPLEDVHPKLYAETIVDLACDIYASLKEESENK